MKLAALLFDRIDNKGTVNKIALKALELSKVTTPDFVQHKTLGIIKVADNQLMKL